MVQIIDTGGDFGSRLGASFGKGLLEQVPKEIERRRLSSGLQRLKEGAADMSPFEQISSLYSIPGMRPEIASAILPYLREEGIRQEEIGLGNVPSIPKDAPEISRDIPESRAERPIQAETVESIVTPESSKYLVEGVVPKTEEQLNQEAVQLMIDRPRRFRTLEKARGEIDRKEGVRLKGESAKLATAERQQSLENTITKDFQDVLSRKIQKGGAQTYSDVLGDLQNDFINKARADVATGRLTTKQAVNKYADQALNFAKTRQNLKSLGLQKVYSQRPSEAKKSFKKIREEYNKLGMLEEYAKDLQASQGLSEGYAYNTALPPTKSVKSLLNKIEPLGPLPTGAAEKRQIKALENFNKKIGKNLTKNDSLFSIGLELQEKGLNEIDFFDHISNLSDQGEIELSDSQERELQNRKPIRKNLNDFWYFTMSKIR